MSFFLPQFLTIIYRENFHKYQRNCGRKMSAIDFKLLNWLIK